jgi:hypothetical protein
LEQPDHLKTGEVENEAKRGEDVFATLYADPARLKQFLSAVTGISICIPFLTNGETGVSQ